MSTPRIGSTSVSSLPLVALLLILGLGCSSSQIGPEPTHDAMTTPPEAIRFAPKSSLERLAFTLKANVALAGLAFDEIFERWRLEDSELPLRSPVTHPELTIEKVMVPMRDGIRLRTHLYRPEGGDRYPVIMARSPYDALSALDMAPALYREFARRGYAVVAQDVRGRYGSEGEFSPLINEIDDTFDAIDWAAKQPWSTGRVGITGVSYQGAVAFFGGIGQHPALEAIMPVCMDLGLSTSRPDGAPALGSIGSWLLFAGQPTDETVNPFLMDFDHLPLTEIDDEAGSPSEPFDMYVSENPAYQVTMSDEEIEDYLSKIEIPTLVTAGWFDVFNEAVLANYQIQARLHPDTTTLLVGPWHHNLATHHGRARIGQVPTPEPHLDHYWQAMEMFFDHHLKGEENELTNAPGPVRRYVMGANEWRYEPAWPPKAATSKSLYLTSDGGAERSLSNGRLGWSMPGGSNSDSYDYDPLNPIKTLEGMSVWEFVDDLESRLETQRRRDVLVYTSPIIEEAVEVAGSPTATIYAASSAPDTDFIVTLSDVYPDGHVQYLTHGIVRATYRNGDGARTLIEPGRVYEYVIRLRPTSNSFGEGHRIRIDITSSDMDRYARNQNVAAPPGQTAEVAIARQTIHHGGEFASRVDLPVIR